MAGQEAKAGEGMGLEAEAGGWRPAISILGGDAMWVLCLNFD